MDEIWVVLETFGALPQKAFVFTGPDAEDAANTKHQDLQIERGILDPDTGQEKAAEDALDRVDLLASLHPPVEGWEVYIIKAEN